MADPKILEDNERGQTRVEGNAFCQCSHIQDAAEVRVGSPSGPGSGGGGKVSYDVLPDGPGGPKREIASMMAGEGSQGAEWKLILLKKDGQTVDADQVTVMEATAQGVEFKVPVKGASAFDGKRIYHEGGIFVTIYQDDGHIVTYDMRVDPWRPLWGNWEGAIVPPPWL